MDHAHIAHVLKTAAPGRWVVIDEDTTRRANSRVNNWRNGAARGQRPKAFGKRFEFKVESCGYGTGRSKILARYTPKTKES